VCGRIPPEVIYINTTYLGISMFIYVCGCIGLRNIVIIMYMYLTMLYPINDLNLIVTSVVSLNFLLNSVKNLSLTELYMGHY
jgi:hypothetical protein